MTDRSRLETVAGGLPTTVVANAFALLAAPVNPVAAFVPVLLQALATRRQAERVDRMLSELNGDLSRLSARVDDLSDDQYKVACEAVAAAFSTIDEAKLQYLRRAAVNVILDPGISTNVGDALGRAIRDLSASEARFMIEHFGVQAIFIETATPIPTEPGKLVVKSGSHDEITLSGLIRLGLAYTRSSSWDSSMFEWSPLVAKLIVLLMPIEAVEEEKAAA